MMLVAFIIYFFTLYSSDAKHCIGQLDGRAWIATKITDDMTRYKASSKSHTMMSLITLGGSSNILGIAIVDCTDRTISIWDASSIVAGVPLTGIRGGLPSTDPIFDIGGTFNLWLSWYSNGWREEASLFASICKSKEANDR